MSGRKKSDLHEAMQFFRVYWTLFKKESRKQVLEFPKKHPNICWIGLVSILLMCLIFYKACFVLMYLALQMCLFFCTSVLWTLDALTPFEGYILTWRLILILIFGLLLRNIRIKNRKPSLVRVRTAWVLSFGLAVLALVDAYFSTNRLGLEFLLCGVVVAVLLGAAWYNREVPKEKPAKKKKRQDRAVNFGIIGSALVISLCALSFFSTTEGSEKVTKFASSNYESAKGYFDSLLANFNERFDDESSEEGVYDDVEIETKADIAAGTMNAPSNTPLDEQLPEETSTLYDTSSSTPSVFESPVDHLLSPLEAIGRYGDKDRIFLFAVSEPTQAGVLAYAVSVQNRKLGPPNTNPDPVHFRGLRRAMMEVPRLTDFQRHKQINLVRNEQEAILRDWNVKVTDEGIVEGLSGVGLSSAKKLWSDMGVEY